MNAVGINVQRKGQMRSNGMMSMAGVALSAAAGIADMSSFSYAPQSLLAPMSAMTLVVNLFVAPCLNNDEKITTRDVIGTIVICSGVAGCILSSLGAEGAGDETSYRDVDEFVAFVSRPDAIRFTCTIMVTLLMMFLAMFHLEARKGRLGLAGAVYPFTCGVFVMITVTSAKSIGSIGSISADESTAIPMAIAIALVIVTAIANTVIMNRGFKFGNSALFSMPICCGSAVLLNTLSGAIFWGEAANFEMNEMRALVASIAVLLCGVGVLLSKSSSSSSKRMKEKKKKS